MFALSGGYSRAGNRFESRLGRVFSLYRGSGPLSVHKLFTDGPCGSPFLSVAVYVFKAGNSWDCMTCCDWGSNLHDHPCRLRKAGQPIRWAKDTIIPSGPRT